MLLALIAAALLVGVVSLYVKGAGRNRTPGDRLTGVDWFEDVP